VGNCGRLRSVTPNKNAVLHFPHFCDGQHIALAKSTYPKHKEKYVSCYEREVS
jgi:hypothetical protein